MVLHGGMKCLKYVVLSFNFVVWLAGMGILGFAIWLRMEPSVNHYVRASYVVDESYLYSFMCYLLMATGGVVTFVGFLGCCGAFQESRCMLGTFVVLLILVFGAEVAGGVWGFILKKRVKDSVSVTYTHLLQNYYGTGSDQRIHEAIDYVQSKLKCCGGKSATDWQQNSWVQQDIINKNKLPWSCCRQKPPPKSKNLHDNGFENKNTCRLNRDGAPPASKKSPKVWKKPCGPELKKWLEKHLLILAVIGIAVATIEFIGMLLSLILCCSMRWSRGGGYKS